MSKDLAQKAEILKQSLDAGQINLNALRAFLAEVATQNPNPKKEKKNRNAYFLESLRKIGK